MPVVFRYRGCRFFFYSNEGIPREPLHIHVQKGERVAKFWIEPSVSLAGAFGFSSTELRELAEAIEKNKPLIARVWNDHFNA